MARWNVIVGPVPLEGLEVDGRGWGVVVENAAGERHPVEVVISGQAMNAAAEVEHLQRALDTEGLSVIELYLDERDPPRLISVTADAIRIADS